MGRKIRIALAVLAIALPLAACSSPGSDLPPLPPGAAAETGIYHLDHGDKLSIKVLGAEEMTGNYTVGDNGTVSLPLVGEVKVQGLTRDQVEQAIAQKLRAGYIKNPQVSIGVETHRPFYIYGEVAKPGEYPYASGMKVLNAIATAGGFTYRANENFVVVRRNGQENKAVATTPILPDDIIRVPERYF